MWSLNKRFKRILNHFWRHLRYTVNVTEDRLLGRRLTHKKNNYQSKIPSLQSETCQGVCLLFDIVWRSLATPTQHMLRVIIYIVWNFKTTYPANSYIEMKMMKCLGAKAECSGKGGGSGKLHFDIYLRATEMTIHRHIRDTSKDDSYQYPWKWHIVTVIYVKISCAYILQSNTKKQARQRIVYLACFMHIS